jgi:methylase of polypeptide subunit release factors
MANAAEAWSAAASAYSDHVDHATSQGGEALLKLVETLRPLSANSLVFDSGAGTGALTSLLASKNPHMYVASLPISHRGHKSKKQFP